MLNVKQSYVFAQQQGLLNRIGNFFSGNPNSQQQVYILAQQKIQTGGPAERPARRRAAEYDRHAHQHDALTGLPAGHRELRRAARAKG